MSVSDSSALYFTIDFYNDVKSSIKNSSELNLNALVNHLTSFCFTEKFIPFLYMDKRGIFDIISIYEMKEKFLSLRIIFPFIAELKKLKFDNKIIQISELIKGNQISNEYESFCNKNGTLINEFVKTEECQKVSKEISQFIEKNKVLIENLYNLYAVIFLISFYDTFIKFGLIKDESDKILNQCLYEFKKYNIENEIQITNIFANLNIDKHDHINNVYQNFLFVLNTIKNEKELSLRDKIGKEFFDAYGNTFNINDRLIWTIYEKDLNESKSGKKYIKTILEGKTTEKEKFNFDIFDHIIQLKIKEDNKGISGAIYQSLFYNKKILIIKIDLDYFKNNNKISFEQFKNKINLFQNSLPSNAKNIDTYIQIENKIINFDSSFDLLIKELNDKKIIEENKEIINMSNIKNEKKGNEIILQKENDKIQNNLNIERKDNNKIFVGQKDLDFINESSKSEIEEIKMQLIKEKDKNKKLEDKIKILERDLTDEKNKNKKSDIIIVNLRKELENEKKKI